MKYHVVVVENEPTLLDVLVRSLEAVPQFHISACSCAEDVIKILEVDPPDCLLTDVNLPGRSGLSLITELQSRSINIPVVVMSAYSTDYEQQLAQHPSLRVIEKPAPVEKIQSVIEELLSLHSVPTPLGPFELTDYLQLAGIGQHSLHIQVELENGARGHLEIVKGNIWNAFLGELQAGQALVQMLKNPIHRLGYTSVSIDPVARQMHKRWEELLLDLARVVDEGGDGIQITESGTWLESGEGSGSFSHPPDESFEFPSFSGEFGAAFSESTQPELNTSDFSDHVEAKAEIKTTASYGSFQTSDFPFGASAPSLGFFQEKELSPKKKKLMQLFFKKVITEQIKAAWIFDTNGKLYGAFPPEATSFSESISQVFSSRDLHELGSEELGLGAFQMAEVEYEKGRLLSFPLPKQAILVVQISQGVSQGLLRFQLQGSLQKLLPLLDEVIE